MDRGGIIAGKSVHADTDPSKLGVLTGKVMPLGDLLMAQVKWGANAEFVDVERLVEVSLDDSNDMDSLVFRSAYGTIQDFRRRITYEKLQGTITDVFYSMAAAQIDFLPHQFKPVLRFIDSPTNRLLIADEVGLGKTIEGGLIWLECQARYGARRLMVVCPATLRLKWQRELRDRFQVDALLADADMLEDLLDQYERKGDKLSFCIVCSYNAIRPKRLDLDVLAPLYDRRARPVDPESFEMSRQASFLKRLSERSSGSAFADLVLFDEAAVMKNTASASYALGRILSSESDACVSLSATPIHNSSRDLYALLTMVDPDYFSAEYTFDLLRRNNQPLVRLQNILTRPPISRSDLMAAVDALDGSEYLRGSAIVQQVKDLIAKWDGSIADAVHVFQLVEKLNLLSGYICRTRKLQISTDGRVQRRSRTLTVEYSQEEMKFYKALLRFIRQQARSRGVSVTSFHTMAPALLMSSCLPAVVAQIRNGRWGGIEELIESEGEEEFLIGIGSDNELDIKKVQTELQWIRDYDFRVNDTKYRLFRDDLIGQLKGEKVIVFAFFKDTLRYLSDRLHEDGIKSMLLTGDITNQRERENIIFAFEDNDAQVLLCSEVVAEGIDLQFCRTLVNYDLPWNPMRVEQRIGRIDRIGQKAKTINIVNFCINGTIDGLIYTHLYSKIGVFENTIGDLESIIGPEIAVLTSALLSDTLSEEEEVRLIKQTELAIENRLKSENELEKTSNDFMAYSDYLAEQVGDSRRLGRYVKPSELRLYLSDYFAREYAGCHLDWDTPVRDCCVLSMTFEAADSLASYVREHNLALPPGTGMGGRTFKFTLDPEVYQQIRRKHREYHFVNHLHPLIRWVTRNIRDSAENLYRLVGVRGKSDKMPAGQYFFLVRRLTLKGLHHREHLFYACRNHATGTISQGNVVEDVLNGILESGESSFNHAAGEMSSALDELKAVLDHACNSTINAYKEEMEAKRTVQAAQSRSHFERKIEITERQIESMKRSGEDRRKGISLSEARLKSLREGLRNKMAKLDRELRVDVSADNVVCGLLEVSGP